MKSVTQVYLYDEEKFFGEGPYRLLKNIEIYGSVRAAAMEMGLSYNKANLLLKRAEKSLGFPLTKKQIGGIGGGGSQLTEEAKDFMDKYVMYRDACYQENEKIFHRIFGKNEKKIGCVLMASGLGNRFGKNKLLEEIDGKSMFEHMLEITSGNMFSERVVVTRTPEIEAICKKKEIPVIFHEFPNRNDTVRLGTEYLKKMDGILFCSCDQPLLQKGSIKGMAEQFQKESDFIYRLAYKNKVGNPVLFPQKYYKELCELPEKKGGAFVARQHEENVRLMQANEEMELFDIDTTEDLEKVLAYRKKKEEF